MDNCEFMGCVWIKKVIQLNRPFGHVDLFDYSIVQKELEGRRNLAVVELRPVVASADCNNSLGMK